MVEAKPQILRWTVPECPYRVTIPGPVLNEIRISAVEAFYSVPRGGVEIGGVFFGIHEGNGVEVRTYRPIVCEYATGPSFTLSAKDQAGLKSLLDRVHSEPELAGLSAIGWYHSHTRSEVFLSLPDLQIYQKFFPESWQIALVLRPANLQPTRAGFFFRDIRGVIRADAPVKELMLEPPSFGLEAIGPWTPGAEAKSEGARDAIGANGVSARQPAVKGTPEAALNASPTVGPAAAAVGTAAAVVPVSVVGQEAAHAAGPAMAAATVAEAPTTAPGPAPADAAAHREVALPGFLARSLPASSDQWNWMWFAAGLAVLAIAALALVFSSGRYNKPADLGLETYDINGAFLIRWDRDSSIVRGATRARLEIQDGADVTPIELSRIELTVGGYGYMRHSGQVSVRMIVDGPTHAEEYSNFNGSVALGSQQQEPSAATSSALAKALMDKQRFRTELLNESTRNSALQQEIDELRKQLSDERARNGSSPDR